MHAQGSDGRGCWLGSDGRSLTSHRQDLLGNQTFLASWKGGRDTRPVVKCRRFSSAASPVVSRELGGARIYSTSLLHKRFQACARHLAIGDIPECSRPFADCFVVDGAVTRAANNGTIWFCGFVEWKASTFEGMPQKCFRLSPRFVMFNDASTLPPGPFEATSNNRNGRPRGLMHRCILPF